MFLCPKIQGRGCYLIDDGLGEAVLREIDRFDVLFARIAALHPDVIEVLGQIYRKLLVVFLPTAGTDNSSKVPLCHAERADEGTASAVSLLTQNGESRLSSTQWASPGPLPIQLHLRLFANELGTGLQKRSGQELFRIFAASS